MTIQQLPVSKLAPNKGQIDGLPANPRQWTQADIDKIAKSLKETPELFEMRPCIVYEVKGKYIILGGNLRYTGAKQNGDNTVPCIVVPKDTPVDKMKEIVIKDNGSFGQWDYDALGNEWDDLPLADFGVPAWDGSQSERERLKEEYSRKIESPVYEAKVAEKVDESECFDDGKTRELLEEIDKAKCGQEIKDFLRLAAYRHTKFHFAKIADYYAQADPETKRLMEHSGMVIVDFGSAVESGFVQLSRNLVEEYLNEYGDAE